MQIIPIFFPSSVCNRKYFHAQIRPKGGIKRLIRYTTSCLPSSVETGFSFNFFPQLGQKKSASVTEILHTGQCGERICSGVKFINLILILLVKYLKISSHLRGVVDSTPWSFIHFSNITCLIS